MSLINVNGLPVEESSIDYVPQTSGNSNIDTLNPSELIKPDPLLDNGGLVMRPDIIV